jgi:hypothetical protein
VQIHSIATKNLSPPHGEETTDYPPVTPQEQILQIYIHKKTDTTGNRLSNCEVGSQIHKAGVMTHTCTNMTANRISYTPKHVFESNKRESASKDPKSMSKVRKTGLQVLTKYLFLNIKTTKIKRQSLLRFPQCCVHASNMV